VTYAERLAKEVTASTERDWPRTRRVLPWLATAAVTTVLLAPIDSMTLPVALPFDARPDRLLLAGCLVLWGLVVCVHAPARPPGTGYRFGAVEVLLVLFLCVAILSAAVNWAAVEALDESSLVVGKLLLLASYLAFYLLIVGTVRRSEVPSLVRLVVALGVVAAIGTIVEYSTGTNLFFTVASALSPPGTEVTSGAELVAPDGRPDITGPTRHGLAVSTMLAMVLPLALVGAVFAQGSRDRLLYRVAVAVLLVGCVATFRRSGVVLPFLACTAVIFGGGRRMLPLAAVFVALTVVTPVVAPSVVSEITAQFSSSNVAAQQSIEGRMSDYSAVMPDLRAGALLGRGFGSYEARRYRFLDNQYLALAIETGFVGVAAYLAVILVSAGVALRTGIRRVGPASWIGLAVFGSALAFLAANALFDALAFPQAPYAFMLLVALAGISSQAAEDEGDDAPALGL